MGKELDYCSGCGSVMMRLCLDCSSYMYMWCPECGIVVKWDCIGQRLVETITPRKLLRESGVGERRKNEARRIL